MESMISKLWNQLIALGLFSAPRLPFVSKDKQFALFFSCQPQALSVCKNDGDMTDAAPGMLGGGRGFIRVAHLRGESVVWSSEEYDSDRIEGLLNELLIELILTSECNLGRGLTDEAASKLFREQNPHMLSEGVPGYCGPVGALGVPGLPKLTDEDYIRGLEQRLRLTFKGDKEYADYLQRLIQLQEMNSLRSSWKTASELEPMYPRLEVRPAAPLRAPEGYMGRHLDPSEMDPLLRPDVALDQLEVGNTMKSVPGEHYIPQPDEPSPFGPDQKDYVDNPWITWKYQQADYYAPRDGSAALLRERLLEELRDEKYRTMVDLECVPSDLQTSSGHLSLGYVIHIHHNAKLGWEESHQYGLTKIQQFDE